jgi:ubiquinone biosynthesis protein
VGRLIPFQRGWLGHERRDTPYTRPEHLRLALEDLGTTFIKLGQIASTRGDLMPPEYQAELARLQDGAPPVPAADIFDTISTAFGCRVESVFADFDLAPLAAASIGQVHAATLVDGSDVVVKIRRPGVVAQVDEDLELLNRFARRVAKRSETARHYDVAGLAAEFGGTLRQELDYLREGRNAERFAAHFGDDPSIHIPRVHWEATTPQILTLERLRGVKASEPAALDATGLDRPALAHAAALITLRMVFEHGFFHADPHPGNFFVEPDGTIGLIDFGMVGSVDAATRDRLAALLAGFATNNGDVLLDNILALGIATTAIDRAGLRADLLALAADQLARPLGDVAFGTLLGGLLGVIRRHHLVLPIDLALVVKTIAMSEGVGAQIDPSFQLASVLLPFLSSVA